MHYGRLLICWAPQGSKLPSSHIAFQNATGFPWVQISASQQTPVTFSLPYTHYQDIISTDPADQVAEIFRFWIYVSVPLSSLNGTPAPVELTTFVRVTNHNLMGYNNFEIQGDFQTQGKTESEQKSKGGTISTIARTVAQVAAPLSALPEIGPIASAVSSVASIGASIAQALGFSIPANTATTSPFQIRMPRFQLGSDVPQTAVLAAHAEGETVRDYALVNDTVEAADLLKFAQRPFMVGTFPITVNQATDQVVWSTLVDPSMQVHNSSFFPLETSKYYPSPLAWTTRCSRYWRGSIRFHFSVIASNFHSCRLVLYYLPHSKNGSYPGKIAQAVSAQVVKKVIDINEETEFTLEVPYLQPYPWAQCTGTRHSVAYAADNGCLYLSILNPLTAGTTPVNPIYVQVFVSAGDDFQWALPSTYNVRTAGELIPSTAVVDELPFETQGTNEIAPSLSEDLLRKAVAKPFVFGTKKTRIPEQTFHTDEVRSIKTLCNMLAPFEHRNLVVGDPAPISSDIRQTGFADRWYNFLYEWKEVFRYWRGGVRLATIDSDNKTRYSANVVTAPNVAVGGFYETAEETPHFYGLAQSSTIWPGTDMTPADFVTPWSSNYKCALTQFLADPTQLLNQGTLVVNSQQAQEQNFWLGGHDDFLLGWQISPPACEMPPPPVSGASYELLARQSHQMRRPPC